MSRAAPVTVAGSGFRARERVRVSVVFDGTRSSRRTTASDTGRLRVVFGDRTYDPCTGGLEVRAVGADGTRAAKHLPQRECPVPLTRP